MNLRQLEVFCTVVEKKSFSKAAEYVHLTQPTISTQIRSLEEELKIKLFDRSGREIFVTKNGEILYSYAQKILALEKEARQALEDFKGLIRGELKIGASTIPGEYILPVFLSHFKKLYPGIEITLTIVGSSLTTQRVLNHEVEVGIVGAKEEGKGLIYYPFLTEELVLIVSPNHRWAKRKEIEIEELRGEPFIAREKASGTRKVVQYRLKEAGIKEEDLKIIMELGSTNAVKKAVEVGIGLSILSEKAIEHELCLGLLKKLKIKNLNLPRTFYLVYGKEEIQSPAAVAFIRFLKKKKEFVSG